MTKHEEPEEPFLTVEAAAELAGISHWTVRSWLSKGLLTRYKAASRTVVCRAELINLVRPKVMPLRRQQLALTQPNGGLNEHHARKDVSTPLRGRS